MAHEPAHKLAARAFLAGAEIDLAELKRRCRACLDENDNSSAREMLERARTHPDAVRDLDDASRADQNRLWTREAMLTSKDPELSASQRHDAALRLLARRFGQLDNPEVVDPEVLGVAGGICKRRWRDLGQMADLRRAADYYRRGAAAGLGDDAYCAINAAFLDELLASLGDDRDARLQRALDARVHIVNELPALDQVAPSLRWWNAASRAEALFGLGRFAEATACVKAVTSERPAPWELETMVHQLAHLARLQHPQPLDHPGINNFFDALVPGDARAMLSGVMGRVGLALSGGGFRASFYHLGLLARLAELDVLRHVAVLSCVSGGSIVGACYWMLLREQLQAKSELTRDDYVELVRDLIRHFDIAVDVDLRKQVQPSVAQVMWRVLRRDQRGALDPEHTARMLNQCFYRPLGERLGCTDEIYMDELSFQPKGHAIGTGQNPFNPSVDNWLRRDKVPVLVLNATTVNTGHAWQFTPTWMGESPWAVHEAADAVPRLEWAWYDKASNWRMPLAKAVAASACVPGVFAPLELGEHYGDGVTVRLIDGGVHDNQGTVALLAMNCNIVLVSDACGQLRFEEAGSPGLGGLAAYATRSMDMLMERVRMANFADLAARRQVGLLQALMFVHMKDGLDAEVKRRRHSQQSHSVQRSALTRSGVRKDFQKALAELRTDLDDFSSDERLALMACGYQMASLAIERDIAKIPGLVQPPPQGPLRWTFTELLSELCSTADNTRRRVELLQRFTEGAMVRL